MVQIVFITGCSEYIAEGCEVAALHYLMKPVKEDKLYAVRRVTRSLFDGTALPLPRGACEPLDRAIIAHT